MTSPANANSTLNKLDADSVAINTATAVVDSVYDYFPVDTLYPAGILTTGRFHEDEVDKEDTQFDWYGIFKNEYGYYLDSTHIITKRIYDPIADEEGKSSGWEVKTGNSDSAILLISGVDGLSKRKIVPVELKDHILPGETINFTYNGIVYTMYATGNKHNEPGNENPTISNYRLFLKANKKGIERTQLLAQYRYIMPLIWFAGDIDGDDIPDFIIDNSGIDEFTAPTLYLSKPAGGTQLLKVMAMHVSGGC